MTDRETMLFNRITNLSVDKQVEIYNEIINNFGNVGSYIEDMNGFEDYAIEDIKAYGISDFVNTIQNAENFSCDDDYFFFNEHGNLESITNLDSSMLSQIVDAIIRDFRFVFDLVREVEEN